MRSAIFLSLVAATTAAAAQERPVPTGGDQRIQSVPYRADQVVRLTAAPGYQLTVALSPDEQIQTVAVGDGAGWQVTAARDGNHLFVRPVGEGSTTNMTVITNVRQYAFELGVGAGAASADLAYTVQFDYPKPAPPPATSAPAATAGEYKLTGAVRLRPIRISDDGHRTFLEWPREVDLPAVYVLDGQGREALVDGMFRGDRLVIDDVAERLVFRIDDQVARAVRVAAGR